MGAAEIQATTTEKREERPGSFPALRSADFRWLLLGTTASNAAQWIQQVTLSWLVYDLTGSGTMLGTLNLVRAVATVGMTPPAGVAIDRFPRRTLMFGTNFWLLLISLVLGISLLAGDAQIWQLFAFTFLGGLVQSVDVPLRQTVVFVILPRAFAQSGVALIQTGWALMRSLGPALGGFLILWVGPAGNFLVQAAAYGLITITITQIRFPTEKTSGARGAPMGNLMEGLRYVGKERTTRAFLLMGTVLPLLIIPIFSALPPIYAKDVFGGGPDVLGFLLSAVGVGGIVGGLVTASLGHLERQGMLQLGALLALSVALTGFALSSELWMALILLAVAGFCEIIHLVTLQTLLQFSIPDKLRGRVTGLANLNATLQPLGALFAGVGADLVGARSITIVMSALVAAICLAVFWMSPTIRGYRRSGAPVPDALSAAD